MQSTYDESVSVLEPTMQDVLEPIPYMVRVLRHLSEQESIDSKSINMVWFADVADRLDWMAAAGDALYALVHQCDGLDDGDTADAFLDWDEARGV